MTKIEEFLTKFDDQHLANLQCAAEDGTLVYHDCNRCLLHHFQGDYSVTKWESEHSALAREAEVEYRLLGPTLNPLLGFTKAVERERRKAILPLIQAEWHRRLREELAKQINEEGEFAQLSPSVR